MEVYAKASLDAKQIACKLSIGCDGLELQLLDDFFTDIDGVRRSADYVLSKMDSLDHPVSVVHAPLLPGDMLGDVCLEEYISRDPEILWNIVKFVETFGVRQNKPIPLVLHSQYGGIDLVHNKAYCNALYDILYTMLCSTTYVQFCFENVMPLDGPTGDLVLSNNFLFDNVDLATSLNNAFVTDRFGTVLDVCHAKVSMYYIQPIYTLLNRANDAPTLETYFERNKSVCKLLHLSDCTGIGFGKGYHGLVPTEQQFAEFRALYEKYNYSCPVTLEVYEDDYYTSSNYAKAYAIFK